MGIDLIDLLRESLARDDTGREPGLYPSMDILGSLRHAQLRAAGAPQLPRDLGNAVTLETGNMWHAHFEGIFKKKSLPVMCEIRINDFLPKGWRGRVDWLPWQQEIKAFKLCDLKTIKPEGIEWIERGGAKEPHHWQVSLYWHALVDMGLPLERDIDIFYLPKGQLNGKEINPVICTVRALDRDLVWGVCEDKWAKTEAYLASLVPSLGPGGMRREDYVTEALAPPLERVQKALWNKQANVFDLKLCPSWETDYCPFPNELCDCSTQGVTKIGSYDVDGVYTARKGYEDIEALVAPKPYDLRKRKEAAGATEGSN